MLADIEIAWQNWKAVGRGRLQDYYLELISPCYDQITGPPRCKFLEALRAEAPDSPRLHAWLRLPRNSVAREIVTYDRCRAWLFLAAVRARHEAASGKPSPTCQRATLRRWLAGSAASSAGAPVAVHPVLVVDPASMPGERGLVLMLTLEAHGLQTRESGPEHRCDSAVIACVEQMFLPEQTFQQAITQARRYADQWLNQPACRVYRLKRVPQKTLFDRTLSQSSLGGSFAFALRHLHDPQLRPRDFHWMAIAATIEPSGGLGPVSPGDLQEKIAALMRMAGGDDARVRVLFLAPGQSVKVTHGVGARTIAGLDRGHFRFLKRPGSDLAPAEGPEPGDWVLICHACSIDQVVQTILASERVLVSWMLIQWPVLIRFSLKHGLLSSFLALAAVILVSAVWYCWPVLPFVFEVVRFLGAIAVVPALAILGMRGLLSCAQPPPEAGARPLPVLPLDLAASHWRVALNSPMHRRSRLARCQCQWIARQLEGSDGHWTPRQLASALGTKACGAAARSGRGQPGTRYWIFPILLAVLLLSPWQHRLAELLPPRAARAFSSCFVQVEYNGGQRMFRPASVTNFPAAPTQFEAKAVPGAQVLLTIYDKPRTARWVRVRAVRQSCLMSSGNDPATAQGLLVPVARGRCQFGVFRNTGLVAREDWGGFALEIELVTHDGESLDRRLLAGRWQSESLLR